MREYPVRHLRPTQLNFLSGINWTILFLVVILGLCGVVALYSAAGGAFTPWAWQHALRVAIGLVMVFAIATVNIRFWYQAAYPIYAAVLLLLVSLEAFGSISMGARRWLDLNFLSLQPSEFMRIGLVLALARYYHGIYQQNISSPLQVTIPFLLIATPCLLILRQPDLGTMVLMVTTGISVMFLAGLSMRYFIIGFVGLMVMIPTMWSFLHQYQRERWLTFLNPERDPLGTGYHIIQSKISIGSGGVLGKGLAAGSQAQLDFLPENHTDFIFTIIAEEFGFAGSVALLGVYLLLLISIFSVSRRVHGQFSRLLAGGLGITLFIYIAVNLSMAMGLAPVVGVPLPFISYGGTSLIASLISIGLLLSADKNANVEVTRG